MTLTRSPGTLLSLLIVEEILLKRCLLELLMCSLKSAIQIEGASVQGAKSTK